MRNPVQQAVPRGSGLSPELRQQYARAGHEQLGSMVPGAEQLPGLRSLIRESWQRSAQSHANPDNPEAPLAMDREELEEYRRQHPLAAIMPVIHKLLVLPSHDSGMLVVVDITGTESAVAPHTLSLVEATVAAAQAHLRVERLQLAAARQAAPGRRRAATAASGNASAAAPG